MSAKKKSARRSRQKLQLLPPASLEPSQSAEWGPETNRIQEVTEEPTLVESSTPSESSSEKPVATDAFEAAVNDVAAELGGEFAEPASSVAVGDPVVINPDAEALADEEAIAEILKPENLKLYLDVPFDLAADFLQRSELKLKPHERALLLPITRKYVGILMRSSESPEFAAFTMFLIVYGGRVGLTEWAMPKLAKLLGRDTATPVSAA